MDIDKAKIMSCVSERKKDIISDLFTMVRINSVRGITEIGKPFGSGPAKALNFAIDLYRKHGYKVDPYTDDGYALVRISKGLRRFGIFTHCDVVSVNGEWKFGKPFEPSVYKGLLVGRGVKDDKGAVIAALYALDAIRTMKIPLKNQVSVFLGSNEESGMADITDYLKVHGQPDLGLVPDVDYAVCRGEKGMYNFRLEYSRPFETIIDFSGGEVPNAVCPKLTVLMPDKPGLCRQIESQLTSRNDAKMELDRNGRLCLTAIGVSTHAAAPEGSINAGAVAADILRKCPALGDNDQALMQYVYEMLKGYLGEFFNIQYRDEDFKELTTISGIIRTVEGKLVIGQRCCYNTAVNSGWIERNIREKVEKDGWIFEFEEDSKGILYPKDDPYVISMNELYEEMIDGPARGIYTSRGGTYARKLKYAFSCGMDAPQTVFPCEYPIGHGKPHQPDECIDAESFIRGIGLLAMMIIKMDRILFDSYK